MKPTQFPVYDPEKPYEKKPHKFNIGDEVTLPGARIRGPHYKNQFMYNVTGIIEKRGWSTPVCVRDKKIPDEETGGSWWSRKLVHAPMYFVKGRWYAEGKKNYGVTK